jgi:hypothetical protein
VFCFSERVIKATRRKHGRGAWIALACLLAAGGISLPAPAQARNAYTPPKDKIWHGVSDTGHVRDYRRFNRQVGAHTALDQVFFHWGVPLTTGALDRWRRTNTRGVLSLSTAPGGRPEVISPRQISRGRGDHYALRLNASIDNSGQVVYIRPFGEMNLHINPYSAFNADGSKRAGHSTRAFKLAWKRLVLIVRGGKRDRINDKLRRLGMPRIYRAKRNDSKIYKRRNVPRKLDHPKVAFMWMPLTRGSPNVPGNKPNDYFPGRKYVDWVGTDVYSKFSNPTLWKGLTRFFNHKRGYPFAIGEYGPWDNDYSGEFTERIHRWARKRTRVRALLYFRGVDPDNEFNLQHYPEAKRTLRSILNRGRYAQYAPGTRR